MVFSGRLFKIFPMPNDATNTWLSPLMFFFFSNQGADVRTEAQRTLFMEYLQNLSQGVQSGNYSAADASLDKITAFQQSTAAHIFPFFIQNQSRAVAQSTQRFGRLRNYYGLLALGILGLFFYTVLKVSANRERNGLPLLLCSFIWFHFSYHWSWPAMVHFRKSTVEQWLRIYDLHRMDYRFGWLTFLQKSLGGLAATMTLAATILLVASMSWPDPEITPLVPVLKSYWLTIHVSLEAAATASFMLGAVIGMLNLILLTFTNDKIWLTPQGPSESFQ